MIATRLGNKMQSQTVIRMMTRSTVLASPAPVLTRLARPSDVYGGLFAPAMAIAAAGLVAAATKSSSAAKCETAPVLDKLEIMDVTATVLEVYSLPLVPGSLQTMVVQKCVEHVVAELPILLTPAQLAMLRSGIDKVGEGFTPEERKKLASDIAAKMDVPLVSKSERENVATKIIDIIMGDSQIVGKCSEGGAKTAVALLDAEGRKRLATRLNEKINLPFMSEEQEQVLFEKFIDAIGKPLEAHIPKQYRDALKGATAAEIEQFKLLITQTTVSKVPTLGMIDEKKETELIRMVVDTMFDSFLDCSGADGVLLAPELQLERIKVVEETAKLDLELGDRRHKRQVLALKKTLADIQMNRKRLEKEVDARAPHYFYKAAAATVLVGGVGAAAFAFKPK